MVIPVEPPSSDLLASLSDDIDIAEWVNDLLDNHVQLRDGHGDVSELSTRLEVACQDTSSQLEQSIDDISRIVPRLAYDLHFLRESSLSLKAALSSLQARVSTLVADDDTTQALHRLSYLDTVKARMEASRNVLREAEGWSTLEPEVTSLLSESNYEKAAERLADASRSMVVFQNTSEYETRRALMTSLQNQLEASLSSALVAAINTRDIASCNTYYAIFTHIQRESEFRNYYNGSRRAPLLQLWTSTALFDVEGEFPQPDESPIKFSELLSRFFTEFLALVKEERAYTASIFPDPQQTLSAFVQSTIDALTPSLSQRLSGVSEHYSASCLPEIIKAFQAAEGFAIATDKILENVGYAALFSPQALAPQADEMYKSHSRRLSKRMSMSRRLGPARPSSVSGSILTSGGGAWEQTLFEPFIDFQVEYQSLEEKHLDHALSSVLETTRRTAADGAHLFRERSVDVFSIAEESLARCMDFTHGYGAVGMLNALDHLLSSFLDSSRIELLAPGKTVPLSSIENIPGDALEELDYSSGDWRAIQLTLHLLEACRAVRERLGVLEIRVRTQLVQVASALRLARSDPQGLYITNSTRGEAQLLNQSTLNSAKLQNLLDKFGPTTMNSSVLGASEAEQPIMLLSGTRNTIVEFAKACQGMLQDTLLAPLFRHLSTYAASRAWSVVADSGKSTHEPSIPTFSLSPTHTIQRIAEGLLNLPRLFEVYADDDALAFSVETLPFVDAVSLREAFAPSPPPSPRTRSPVDMHIRHFSSSHVFSTSLLHRALPPEIVVSAWLSSLTLSLLSHLTTKVLPSIPALSVSGAAQLGSDLEYLSNVVRALNIEWAELEQWKEAVEAKEYLGRQRAKEVAGTEDVFGTVARIRGWI